MGFYEAVAHAHRITINQELKSVAGTLRDSFFPVLERPGKLKPEVNNLLPNTCQIDISKPVKVIGDRQQSYRLITNLVTNAIQYTPAKGKVTLTLTEEHHNVIICVRDTGIGIAKKEQKLIFDRFLMQSLQRGESAQRAASLLSCR